MNPVCSPQPKESNPVKKNQQNTRRVSNTCGGEKPPAKVGGKMPKGTRERKTKRLPKSRSQTGSYNNVNQRWRGGAGGGITNVPKGTVPPGDVFPAKPGRVWGG